MAARKKIATVILVAIGALTAFGFFSYQYWYLGRKSATQEKKVGICEMPLDFEEYVYDDARWSADPFFLLKMKMPRVLFPEAANRGGWERDELAELPIFLGSWPDLDWQFVIRLEYYPSIATTTLQHIDLVLEDATAYANFPREQAVVTKIVQPGELAQRQLGTIECIQYFWQKVDEVYYVEPKSQRALAYFEVQGLAHQPSDNHGDGVRSPFGIYAAKYIDGVPLVLYFSWAKDGGSFFRDKAYSVFDVLWSIRFDAIR